jgi:hypothetical protein
MNKNKNSTDIIKDVCDNLINESLELIDFDQMQKVLTDFQNESAKYTEEKVELTFLKSEYCQRIVGMLKAITACRKDENNLELITSLSAEPNDFDATELVRIYNKTAVTFRSCFPASFKYIRFSNSASPGKNWKEHKI